MNTFEDVRKIVQTKQEFSGFICFKVRIRHFHEYIECMFALKWWPQYKTYIAYPVTYHDGRYFYAHLRVDAVWHCALRWYLRKYLGVKHLHWINAKDNSQRIKDLLRITIL